MATVQPVKHVRARSPREVRRQEGGNMAGLRTKETRVTEVKEVITRVAGIISLKKKWRVRCSVVSNSLQPMVFSPPDSCVHGILQARILEWVAIPFSRKSS